MSDARAQRHKDAGGKRRCDACTYRSAGVGAFIPSSDPFTPSRFRCAKSRILRETTRNGDERSREDGA